MLRQSMPMCEVCNTYYSHKPCPKCQPKHKISNEFHSDKIYTKSFILAPTNNELDFFWSQVSTKTIQRVQSGGQVLRQGFFDIQLSEYDIKLEWIGSTFTQGFYSRLERLYPGTDSIFILSDIVAQNFNFESLLDVLQDLVNVNKRYLKNIFIVWLEPYINAANTYEDYKVLVKTTLVNFFNLKNIDLQINEYSLPLYSTSRFSTQLGLMLNSIITVPGLEEYLSKKIPLRPLFRTQMPVLDSNAPNRVIILDLEGSSPTEPVNKIEVNLNEQIESQKCLACAIEITGTYTVCLVCNFVFCNKCIEYLKDKSDNNEDFCLGSIYHGLHRSTFI